MKNLLFWGAVPFLLPQALYVRKTAPRSAAAAGPTEDSTGDGDEIRLLAVGDSIIAGVGAAELSRALVGQTAEAIALSLDCSVSWQAYGVSGYKSSTILERLVPELPDLAADFVIVSVGVNDITGLTSISAWRKNLSLLLESLRQHSPEAAIAVAGMPPMHRFPLLPQPLRATFGLRSRSFDEQLISIVDEFANTVHVPVEFDPGPGKFAPDGYHPSEEGYTEFGRHMADALLRIRKR